MSVQSPGCPGLCCFCSISPAALRLDGLLAGGAACGIPGGVVPGRATGWWCGLWDSQRRCAWPGYWLVVRPVGYPAALRLDWLLVGGAACGIPGGAAPGLATRWWCGLRVSRRRCAWPGYWWCGLRDG
ncbi:TPA: hypothetical protein MBF22_000936 [Klebsiella aerogenes]|nr:hypothetical protein [Klebsiella aerogenes]